MRTSLLRALTMMCGRKFIGPVMSLDGMELVFEMRDGDTQNLITLYKGQGYVDVGFVSPEQIDGGYGSDTLEDVWSDG